MRCRNLERLKLHLCAEVQQVPSTPSWHRWVLSAPHTSCTSRCASIIWAGPDAIYEEIQWEVFQLPSGRSSAYILLAVRRGPLPLWSFATISFGLNMTLSRAGRCRCVPLTRAADITRRLAVQCLRSVSALESGGAEVHLRPDNVPLLY